MITLALFAFYPKIEFMIFEYRLYYFITNKFGEQMFGCPSGKSGLATITVERKQSTLFQQVEQELFPFRVSDQFSPWTVTLLPYTQMNRRRQDILVLDAEIGERFPFSSFAYTGLCGLFDGGHQYLLAFHDKCL